MKYYNLQFQFHFVLRYFVFTLFFLIARNTNTLSQDLPVDGPLNSTYTQKENADWDFISKAQYGVAGSGFIGHDQFIGICKAKHRDGGPWKPIDGYKRTLCGQLYLPHGGKFNEEHSDGDVDFYIFPDASFNWLLNNSNGNDWEQGTVLGEVAFMEPGNTIASDGYVYLNSLPKQFLSNNMGVYGAWVWDVGHGHPEIHPIEQMWRKIDIDDSTTVFYLFSMHDNKGRFSTPDEFTNPNNIISATDCNIPWIENPQINVFYLPFEVELGGGSIKYNIVTVSENNVNLNNTSSQVTRIINNGNELITIKRENAAYPLVTFSSMGMKNANTIRGYITIETSIAKLGNTRTNGAHLFLKMTRTISQTRKAFTPNN